MGSRAEVQFVKEGHAFHHLAMEHLQCKAPITQALITGLSWNIGYNCVEHGLQFSNIISKVSHSVVPEVA